MAKQRDPLPFDQAQALLHHSDPVHTVQMHPASEPKEEHMSRLRALAHLKEHGAFLAGPLARKANHGLCSPSAGSWKFYETNHE